MRNQKIVVLRAVLVMVLGLCLWRAAQARAATAEDPVAPSARSGNVLAAAVVFSEPRPAAPVLIAGGTGP